jgi:hypothetical protein
MTRSHVYFVNNMLVVTLYSRTGNSTEEMLPHYASSFKRFKLPQFTTNLQKVHICT